MANFASGNSLKTACAMICALVCQKIFFSSGVSNAVFCLTMLIVCLRRVLIIIHK